MYAINPMYIQGDAPVKAHPSDAAYDLVAGECDDGFHDYWAFDPGEWRLVTTGLRMQIPPQHVGLICSRSGHALRRGLIVLNAPGIIDPGYRGDVGVILMNLAHHPAVVRPGDRIAQLLILKTEEFRFVQAPLSQTERGNGGFGSTGMYGGRDK